MNARMIKTVIHPDLLNQKLQLLHPGLLELSLESKLEEREEDFLLFPCFDPYVSFGADRY